MNTKERSSGQASRIEIDTGHVTDHSHALALKLSSHMGIDNAIQISLANQWYGVVAALKLLQGLPKRIK